MKSKIPVKDLQIGMFVVELDRPWLESPFLFQGFLIETQEELGKLQDCCAWVYVDRERGALTHDPVRQPARAAPQGKGKLVERHSASRRVADFRESFQNVKPAYRNAELGVIKVLDDRRLGKLVEAEPVRVAITQLLHNILHDPNASLWLTKVRASDERSAAHAINVAILSLAFAQHLGLPGDLLEAIGLGAVLHDVGLTDASSALVRKQRPLTADEFNIVKRHPVEGLYSIRKAQGLPKVALDIIRWHHERLDGTGYPDGLAGDAIPLHVRVVAIADAYDAMVSDRLYRPGLLPADVMAHMHRTAENTYGRELVQSFIRCVGIYPVGSAVRLNTGAIALVAASDPDSRLTPVVLMLRDAEGRKLPPRQLVDLAATEHKLGERWFIQEMIDPVAHGIDIAALAAEEMRAPS